jgi:hypothetical protein
MKKLLASAVTSAAIFAAAPASAVVVGGIEFANIGAQHLETATLAQTAVTAVGDSFQAYGQISTVNGANNYCAGGTGACSLYYYAYGYTVAAINAIPGGQEIRFTGGTIDVYFSNAPLANLLTQGSPANVAFITGLTPWLRLTGHAPGFATAAAGQTLIGSGVLTGAASLSGTGIGLTDVAGGFGLAEVQAYLNTNGIADIAGGFADIAFTSSFNNTAINPNDTCSANPFTGGAPKTGEWCFQGTSNLRGIVRIPEPSSLALMGGLMLSLGWVAMRRRRDF